MTTERRASGHVPLTASSPRAHNNPAIPRDLQRPVKSEASASASGTAPPPPPTSPDRKRPRYEPALASRGMADEEEMDELDETEDTSKRPRGESDEPKIERKGSGPESISRSSSAAAHHAHWAGRSASAAVDSRYHQQQQQQHQQQQHPSQSQHHPQPPQHRTREGVEPAGGPDPRRYEYERPQLSRYDSGPGMREEGRHIGGLVGERYGGEADREARDRLAMEAKMEYSSSSARMPPPGAADHANLPPGFRKRPPSPPPRLPGFASLEHEGIGHRPREDGMMGGAYSSSPRRGVPFHGPSYGSYPLPQSRTPLMHHHPSPTPSTSYGNPPMIHPALAGLPGAGGGPGGKQQPSFVSKLYSMLEDPSISDLISWGSSGTVFSVANPAEFSRLVLPNWFKHSNWQSFVRQLNMYGFHKVNHSYQGNPTDEVQVWEFRHPSFRRGEIALLNDIKRKSSRQKRGGSPRGSIGGADMRADRSGGSSTPSPEVPLATIPGHDGMRMMGGMGPGGLRGGREFGYGDDRMDPHGYVDRREMRGYPSEREYGPGGPRGVAADEYGYMRGGKVEGHLGLTPAGGPASASGMGPPFAAGGTDGARRAAEPIMERAEAIARFEDLSERTDAIIRHASFLESQIRLLTDQLIESRSFTESAVRDEMTSLLDRLERALSSPAPPGVDPSAKMVEVLRGQLAYYSHRGGAGPNERVNKPPAPSGSAAVADPKRPSV
ncbi:Heat shock transcription factor [Pseudozyma hubeiensis]|nr:Heat shock transcription factor [Pseudozyma hubeiensis]